MLQKLFISDKCWSLYLSIHQIILKKKYSIVLNIDDNNNIVDNNGIITMFLEQQISILEWFLKDHVTLKTGVMMLKFSFARRNKFHFKMYSIRKQLF